MIQENALLIFTKFVDLPVELRRMVWEQSIPEDTPEICIPWPLEEMPGRWQFDGEDDDRTSKFLEPFLVDTCYPVTMHVCQESRGVVSSLLRFRYSLVAGCPVPFRPFRPDLDVFYITLSRPPTNINEMPNWGEYPPGTQHVALDLHTIRDGTFLSILLSNPSLDLRTLTCVVPASGALLDTAVRFRPPVRRCRLRDVEQPTNGSESHIIYVDRGYDRRMTGMARYLQEVQDTASAEFAEILEAGYISEIFLRRWNERELKFDVKFLVKTFEEYRGGHWVPSSKHALRFDHQSITHPTPREVLENTRTYRVSDLEIWTPLRNPETFRVNDIQQNEVPVERY